MDDEQRYLFDLHGYVIIKNAVSPDIVDKSIAALEQISQQASDELPGNAHFDGGRNEHDFRIGGVIECDPIFEHFIDIPEVLDVIDGTSGGQYRLNHAYSMSRKTIGSVTPFHRGAIPMEQNSVYMVQGGQICSNLTKAVFTLTPGRAEHGCFAAVPGSHKSNFAHNDKTMPHEVPGMIPIESDPGDCIIFSEALRHGSTVLESGLQRHCLYYCYSSSWMSNWRLHDEGFSEELLSRLTDRQRHIIALSGSNGFKPEMKELILEGIT